MALEQRNTTRWIARVGTLVVAVVRFVLEVLKAFLNIKEEDDGLLAKGKKAANLVARRAAYFVADYYLMLVSAGVVSIARYLEFPFLGVFFALWTFDILVAWAFIAFFEKTGEDLSLGADLRRAADTVHNA